MAARAPTRATTRVTSTATGTYTWPSCARRVSTPKMDLDDLDVDAFDDSDVNESGGMLGDVGGTVDDDAAA